MINSELKISGARKTDWLIRDMFMLLTSHSNSAIQFEAVYHVQCSVCFYQRAIEKGELWVKKYSKIKTCNFHWLDYKWVDSTTISQTQVNKKDRAVVFS